MRPRVLAIARVLLAPATLLSAELYAQELRGQVRADSQPAVGVIVEVRTGSGAARIAAALTDQRGGFSLRVPAHDTIVVVALRIGYRPTIAGRFALGPGEVREIDVDLSAEAVTLSPVRVVSAARCRADEPDLPALTAALTEVRKSVQSSQLSSNNGRVLARWELTTQLATLRGDPVGEPTRRRQESRTDRPFVGLSVDSLDARGYLVVSGNEYRYAAPDAEALLSERFAAGHCFRLVPWNRDARDWIGVGFAPVEHRRGIVGIEGTAWLDRKTSELRRLEFAYVNLPSTLRDAPAGGDVEFVRLNSGAIVVSRWSIRMPRPTERVEPQYRLGRRVGEHRVLRLETMEIAGGELLDVLSGGASVLAGAPRPAEARPQTIGAAALCEGAPSAGEGTLWGQLGVAVSGDAAVVAEWPSESRWEPSGRVAVERRRVTATLSSTGLWYFCRVPRDTPIEIGLSGHSTLRTWIPPAEAQVLLDLTPTLGVEVDARTERVGRVDGELVDSLRGGPWASAELRILGSERRAIVHPSGRFSIDSLPVGTHTLIATDDELFALGLGPVVHSVTVTAAQPAARVQLSTPSATSIFATRCGRAPAVGESVLVGQVRSTRGLAAPSVEVHAFWSRARIARDRNEREEFVVVDTTDARGQFTLCGVPARGETSVEGDVSILSSGAVTLVATGADAASGEVVVELGGAGLKRRDLTVGRAREVTRASGRVLDLLGRPVPGATIVIGGTDARVARSDSLGRWILDSVPVRSTQLAIRALRYTPIIGSLEPIGGRFIIGDVRLEPAPQVLAAVTVRGAVGDLGYRQAFEDRRRSFAFGTFLGDSLLSRQVVVTPQFVIRHIPKARHNLTGFAVNISGHRARDPQVTYGRSKIAFEVDSRGPEGAMSLCFPRWFIDGVDFGWPAADEEELYLRQAKRIEVYKASLAPPQFNDFDGCGVIVIWTR